MVSNDSLIRRIQARDWDSIVEMEFSAYAELGLSEGREMLRSRAQLSPETCFVLEADGRAAGYLLAFPYPPDRYPDLRREAAAAFPSRNLHLHDLVVAAPLRRRGMARRLLGHAVRTAKYLGYEQLSLVAVGGSEKFWMSRGLTPRLGAVTTGGYDSHAVYMSAPLPIHVPSPPLQQHESR
ncbi:GNAT family N-acetyltransferase [Streptomyces sulphureus]|uniref:GNAT family N-acetyltransferase n=1 Tax=Streptomyces sulphureus TaxID=47758 RepID=UPI001FDF3FB0|nr:GNAT family N-acetyltransferase [Streptomyces sulphureus]